MTIRAPNSPGLDSLNLRPHDGLIDSAGSQRGIGGYGQASGRGGLQGSSGFNGEAVLAADVWSGASRSLPRASPSAYASGPDLAANIERDVDYILSPLF